MLYREIDAVCSDVLKNHRNTVREQNVERLLVKSADMYKVTTGA